MKQVILITGCSSGLGKFLAEKLSQRGSIVYAGVRNESDKKNLEGFSQEKKVLLHPVILDVTRQNTIHAAIKRITTTEKRIDVLINNAGYTLTGPAMSVSMQDFQKLLDVNVLGAFALMQAVYPSMKKNGRGKIINITSLNGLLALPNFSLYSASKFALQALSIAMRYELQKERIWITTLAPGAIGHNHTMDTKELPHKPAREKFFLLKLLMPMVKEEEIAKEIETIIASDEPKSTIILGNDAYITLFLQRFLPAIVWEKLMHFVFTA